MGREWCSGPGGRGLSGSNNRMEAETPDVLRGIPLILGFSQNHFTANSSMDNMPDHHHAPYLRIF